MKPEEREQLMASLIYGEITDEERRRLETWFAGHPEDQAEYEELRKSFARARLPQPLPDHLVPPLSATHLVRPRDRENGGCSRPAPPRLPGDDVLLCFQGMSQVGSARWRRLHPGQADG